MESLEGALFVSAILNFHHIFEIEEIGLLRILSPVCVEVGGLLLAEGGVIVQGFAAEAGR